MNFEDRVRAEILDLKPYVPGKPAAELRREMGLSKILKLASNENFLGASPKAVAALRASAKDAWIYPEGASPILRRAAAAELGVSESSLIVGSGSDEIIRLLCEAFLSPGDEAVCSQYAFIRFAQQARMMGAALVEVPAAELRHDAAAMAKAVGSRTKLVYLVSPNNPTGNYTTRAELSAFLRAVPRGCVVVLDEAYYHFAAGLKDYPDSIGEFLSRYENLIVLRTFSKAYGLAGLRVGLGIASPSLIPWLDRVRMPFNVSAPAQVAALAALGDKAFLRRVVSLTGRNREALRRGLGELGLSALDSAANFLCVKTPIPGKELFRELLRQGVIVRPLDEYGLEDFVRISVGSDAQNRALLAALKRVFSACAAQESAVGESL